MADVVCQSVASSPARRIHVISRHGLVPPPQTVFQRTTVSIGDHRIAPSSSVRRLMAETRGLAQELERMGGDWRTAIATVRLQAPALWQALPETERRRFLRHVRSYWDVHRHRLPEAVRARIEALHARGQLRLHAGRIRAVEPRGGALNVHWVPRGQTLPQDLLAGEIAICTGPDYGARRLTDPLWRNLLTRGTVRVDALDLGIHTGPYGALIGREGHVAEDAFYLGPMLRADHWEVTAVGELRVHAEALARHLLVQHRVIG